MIDRPVFITGLMRSGTSMVAQIVNRLGFHIAPFIPAPGPPSWRGDWEDPALTLKLIRGERIHWAPYVAGRKEYSQAMGFGGRISVKSPYLALHHKAISDHVAGAFWIRCERQADAVERSMSAHPQLSLDHQVRIERALGGFQPDLTWTYEDAIADPQGSVGSLAAALLATDAESIEAAALTIGKQTEYATCPQ